MTTPNRREKPAAKQVRSRVRNGGERFWGHTDFPTLPAAAVSQALSRLTHAGELQRVHKGVYYRGRPTVVGASRPERLASAAKASRARLQPAGLTAANWLGFTPQNPARGEFAVSAPAAPSSLADARVFARRPPSRESLTDSEAALLEFLRDRGATSDLSDVATCTRLLELLADRRSFARLAGVALDEPPRVRAILGAAGEQQGMSGRPLQRLRASLNPLSRYDFGRLACLETARSWQAK
jgi:hypothetical protein